MVLFFAYILQNNQDYHRLLHDSPGFFKSCYSAVLSINKRSLTLILAFSRNDCL